MGRTNIKDRKSILAKRRSRTFEDLVPRNRTITKKVWVFEIPGDINSRVILKHDTIANTYVKSGKQEAADRNLTTDDARPYSTEVWIAKCRMQEETGEFLTPWQRAEKVNACRHTVTLWGDPAIYEDLNKKPKRKLKPPSGTEAHLDC